MADQELNQAAPTTPTAQAVPAAPTAPAGGADEYNMPIPPEDAGPGQAASSDEYNLPIPQGAMLATSPTPTQPKDDEGPGIFGRTFEGSGLKGIAGLVGAIGMRPIDLYHEAVDAAKKGDWKTATATAFKLIHAMPDKDDPLLRAAEEIIMHPVREIEAQAKENRQAGGTAANPMPGIMSHTVATLAKTKADLDKGERLGAVGDVIGGVLNNHIVGAAPLVGAVAQQIGGNLDTDLHRHAYGAIVGDVLGPILTMGIGKAIGALGEGMAGAEEGAIVPTTGKIAGVDVPVSAPQIEAQPFNPAAGKLSRLGSYLVRKSGTAQGAQGFIDDIVQPKAVEATSANIGDAAVDLANDFRTVSGQPPLGAKPPMIRTVDDASEFLASEAKPTFETLDKAVEPEVQQWEHDKAAWERDNPKPGSQPISPSTKTPATPGEVKAWQAAKDSWETANPKPKTFTELQDQIKGAQRTLDADGASQVDKAAAVENLPKYQKELRDYMTNHGSVVDPAELAGANRLWAQSYQYEWLAKRIRSATSGTTDTRSMLKQQPMQLSAGSLKGLKSSFENRFGEGSFEKALGTEGVENFNDVQNSLRNPYTGGRSLLEFVQAQGWLGKTKATTGLFVNKLLFDPVFGQKVLQLWRNAGTVMKGTGKAVKAAPVVGPAISNKKSARDVYAATEGSLGGSGAPQVNPKLAAPYTTQLTPDEEQRFQRWVQTDKIPWRDEPKADYDMRGFWKAQQSGTAQRATNQHFPDTWKTPYHKSFSNESMYAKPDDPHWEGNRLINKDGKVVFEER